MGNLTMGNLTTFLTTLASSQQLPKQKREKPLNTRKLLTEVISLLRWPLKSSVVVGSSRTVSYARLVKV